MNKNKCALFTGLSRAIVLVNMVLVNFNILSNLNFLWLKSFCLVLIGFSVLIFGLSLKDLSKTIVKLLNPFCVALSTFCCIFLSILPQVLSPFFVGLLIVFNLSSSYLLCVFTNYCALATDKYTTVFTSLFVILQALLHNKFVLSFNIGSSCLLFLTIFLLNKNSSYLSYKEGVDAVFDGKRKLGVTSVLLMKTPRFFIILTSLLALSFGLIIRSLNLIMCLGFLVSTLLFLLLIRKFSKVLIILVSGIICVLVSSLQLNLNYLQSTQFVYSFFFGLLICACLSYNSFANDTVKVLLDSYCPSIITGPSLALAIGFGTLGVWLTKLIIHNNQSYYFLISSLFILISSFVLIFVSSKFLAMESKVSEYLVSTPNVVVRQELINTTIRKPSVHRRPNIPIYLIGGLGIKALAYFKFGMRVKTKVRVKGPAVVIANHSCYNDQWYVGSICYPTRINYLSTYYWFTFKKARPWLRLMGAIPKAQFATDLSAMKKIKYIVSDKKGVTYIAPEGTVYATGKNGPISPSIVKILKFLKANVYAVKIDGAQLGKAKWQKHQQNNKVDVSLFKLFDKDEVENLDKDYMYEKIVNTLAFDDFAYQKEHNIVVKGNTKAEGLDDLLYLCPHCHKEFTLKTKGNKIYCTNCGLEATINDHYGFDFNQEQYFENYSKWYDYQYQDLKDQMLSNPDFCLKANVIYKTDIVDTDGYVEVGRGVLSLSLKEGWVYKGMLNGKEVVQTDSLQSVALAVIGMGSHIELPMRDGHNRCFVFSDDGRISQKFHIASRVISENQIYG